MSNNSPHLGSEIPATMKGPEIAHFMQEHHPFRTSYELIKPEMMQLAEEDKLAINLDIPASTIVVLGCGPTIKHHREEVLDQLPQYDIATYDKIETYAMAAAWAHTEFEAASAPPMPLQEMSDELTALRELLVSDVTALAKRNLLDGSKLKDLLGPTGYKNVVRIPA